MPRPARNDEPRHEPASPPPEPDPLPLPEPPLPEPEPPELPPEPVLLPEPLPLDPLPDPDASPPLLPDPLLAPASPPLAPPPPPPLQLGAAAIPRSAATMRPRPLMAPIVPPADLVRDVDLLCLDAGNTVVFLDHARLARSAAAHGVTVTAEALVAGEGHTKLALERGEAVEVAWSRAHLAAPRGWGITVGTILASAGVDAARLPSVLDALWPEHVARNFWSLVPEGLADALAAARARGVKAVVISNSEGMLEALFRDVGLGDAFDLVVDSGVVGVEKPDPRIFRVALERFAVPPERALHLGDNYATDVLGARAAGVRVALVDPFDHLAGRHPDVPRVPGAPEVARALAAARGGR